MPGFLLGVDAGSSAIKVALLDPASGKTVASAVSPAEELTIQSPRPGWAEQDPHDWWQHLKLALSDMRCSVNVDLKDIVAVGISYQMHGLVLVDAAGEPLRPAIIWCDGRALPLGERAMADLGAERCLATLLNSPGNFTASRLAWVRENEPELLARATCFLLPGDWLATRLTGQASTTISGLAECILWDYHAGRQADFLLDYFDLSPDLVPPLVPICGKQGQVSKAAASDLGLPAGIPLCWRAGDQPNNAFALGVVDPGQAAASGGTSGVIYGVMDKPAHDAGLRVNSFIHANHAELKPRFGMLACVNGTGRLNSWLKRNVLDTGKGGYEQMNQAAATVTPGAEGLCVLPYGNGSERTLGGKSPGAACLGLDLNRHHQGHLFRAAQEGIAFALVHCLEIMAATGVTINTIRAASTGLFKSQIFRDTLAAAGGVSLELYDTDGAAGAARGAGLGAGLFKQEAEAFAGLGQGARTTPDQALVGPCGDAYSRWQEMLARYQ